MLRAVRLKNFIKFKEDQLIKFDADGVYVFVGENSSGKSSVFEAVRRCLDMRSNYTFFMNFSNPKESSYVVCEFSLPKSQGTILTSFIYINDCGYAKVVVKTDGESKDEVCMDLIRLTKGDNIRQASNFQCEINKEEKESLISNLKYIISSTDKKPVKTFLSHVAPIIRRENAKIKGTENESWLKTLGDCIFTVASLVGLGSWLNKCNFMKEEKYAFTATEGILEALSEQVVFTFGLRSVGGVQWSKSSNLRNGEENYTAAADKCQIIKWFKEREHDGIYDQSKTQKIFKILTCGETFDFSFKERKNGKRVLIVTNDRGQEFNILKIPEGILEAYHISLLLSCNKFKTLLLEEPDRGMHPQMIQKLRSIILPAEKNKIIVIISHNSALLSSKFIRRTFKFYKFREKVKSASEEHRIVNIGDAIGTQGEKMPRLIADERFANVLFARRVLLVEGDSDIIFTSALFSHILNPEEEDSTRRIFDLASDLHKDLYKTGFSSEDLETLKNLLTSLYIMKLGGEGEKDRWHAFCENSKTPRLLLLDNDAVLEDSTYLTDTELKQCKAAIHTKIVTMLEEKGTREEKTQAQQIATDVEETFWKKKNSSKIETDEARLRELDIHYKNVFIEEIKQLRKASGLKSHKLKILPKTASESFKKEVDKVKNFSDWDKARKLLRDHGIFVWKYGDIEDTFLELILVRDVSDDRYQQFSSLNVDLKVHHFRTKPKKKKKKKSKLYMNEKINDEHIKKSINLVIEFCNKDSDMVHFIHFLIEYAKKDIF